MPNRGEVTSPEDRDVLINRSASVRNADENLDRSQASLRQAANPPAARHGPNCMLSVSAHPKYSVPRRETGVGR